MKRGQDCSDRIGVFDIADGAFNPSCEAGNAFIAFGSDAGWKRDRGVHTNLVSPCGADPRQIVREDESGARPLGAMDRNDGLVGQCKTRIEITDRPSVPFGNLAEINVRKHGSGQSKLSWADAFDVHHRHHASDDNWKLNETRGGQFLRTQGRVGSSEIHSPAFYLPDADARSDGLVVNLYPGHGLVGLRPFGQNRIHKRRTSSQHGLREGWRGQARPTQRRDDDQRGEGLTHDKVSVLSICSDCWCLALARSQPPPKARVRAPSARGLMSALPPKADN